MWRKLNGQWNRVKPRANLLPFHCALGPKEICTAFLLGNVRCAWLMQVYQWVQNSFEQNGTKLQSWRQFMINISQSSVNCIWIFQNELTNQTDDSKKIPYAKYAENRIYQQLLKYSIYLMWFFNQSKRSKNTNFGLCRACDHMMTSLHLLHRKFFHQTLD